MYRTLDIEITELDIRDLAIISLIISAHFTMTGRGWLTLLREAARNIARILIMKGLIEDTDINTVIRSLSNIIINKNGATRIEHKVEGDSIQVEIENCTFNKICITLNKIEQQLTCLRKRPHPRPCPVAILYSELLTEYTESQYDIYDIEQQENKCRLGIIRLI
ncbi:MAG: hypothetical protein GXO26_02165 [Crenarchaeota archaeon]|nr:hypothetical protein [Thermoproteota archaeon]